MNYISYLEKLIAEHRAAAKRYNGLMNELLELNPAAKHQEAVRKVNGFGRKMGLRSKSPQELQRIEDRLDPKPRKKSKKAHKQNGKRVKDVIVDAASKFKKPFKFKEFVAAIVNNGFKTTSKNPANLIGVELRAMVREGIFSAKGRSGKRVYRLRRKAG